MKICFKCGIKKPLTDYYKHKKMADGHLNKCIYCAKKDVRLREEINTSTPEGLEKERKRGRDKYYRLNYRGKYKPTIENKRKIQDRYKDKYPEKYIVQSRSSCLKPNINGNHLHHWSYNEIHCKDVIELSSKEHYKLHRFIKYDKKTFMYKTLNGLLLETKQKHIDYYNKIKLI